MKFEADTDQVYEHTHLLQQFLHKPTNILLKNGKRYHTKVNSVSIDEKTGLVCLVIQEGKRLKTISSGDIYTMSRA